MKRDINKAAMSGQTACLKYKQDDLSLEETRELMKRARSSDTDALLKAIATAYYMGYATGQRRGAAAANA